MTSELFQYYRCRRCGSIFRQVGSSELPDLYYPADYGPYGQVTLDEDKPAPSSEDTAPLQDANLNTTQRKQKKLKVGKVSSERQNQACKRLKCLADFVMPILNWKKAIREKAKRRSVIVQQRLNRSQDDLYSVAASFLKLGGKVCDYGCGSTQFLKKLKARVPSINGTGVDIVAHDAAPFEQAGLIFLTTEEFWHATERYDMINMNHVLEHIPDPAKLLERLATKLQQNGILLITTPNARNPWALLFRTSWFALECPRHINIPTLKSLEALARQSGYMIKGHQVQFRYNDFSRSIFMRDLLNSMSPSPQIGQHVYNYSKSSKKRIAIQNTRDSLLDLLRVQAWMLCSYALRPFGFSDRIIIVLSPIHVQA